MSYDAILNRGVAFVKQRCHTMRNGVVVVNRHTTHRPESKRVARANQLLLQIETGDVAFRLNVCMSIWQERSQQREAVPYSAAR
jgi:hypothetical protein